MGSYWKPDKTLHSASNSRRRPVPEVDRDLSRASDAWQACPATHPPHQTGTRGLVCFQCSSGTCERLKQFGLDPKGAALHWAQRPECGAKARSGRICKRRVEPGKRRCRFHGGGSTGPRTPEGRAKVAEAQKKRWERWRLNRWIVRAGNRVPHATATEAQAIKVDDRVTKVEGHGHQKRGPMLKSHPTRVQYENRAKAILRKCMRQRNLSYKELSQLLAQRGVRCSYRSLTNKVSGGGFSAAFLLLCLDALGAQLVPPEPEGSPTRPAPIHQ
jgi:hypothetical protein